MEVVSYHNWSDFMYIDSWGFVVWDFKKTNWRYCIAEVTFIFDDCNKASDNIWTFPRVLVPDMYIWKKTTTWFTCAPVLPCCLCTETMEWNGNSAYLTLRRLPIFTKCKSCRKKFWVGGKTGESVGFPEARHFFFFGLTLCLPVNYFIYPGRHLVAYAKRCVNECLSSVYEARQSKVGSSKEIIDKCKYCFLDKDQT